MRAGIVPVKNAHGKIIMELMKEKHGSKKVRLFSGKDPTTFFRDLRERSAARIVN